MNGSNGSSSRLDRIEKAIREFERANKEANARHEKAWARYERAHALNEEAHARYEQAFARNEEARARNEQAHARYEQAHARNEEDHAQRKRELREIDNHLRRWAALGVQEARRHRKKMQEFDENITRITAAQLLGEEQMVELRKMMKQYLASQRHRNGGRS